MNEPVFQTGSSVTSPAKADEDAPPRAQKGPETVFNPERRAAAGLVTGLSAAQKVSAKSSVVRILFPPDDETAGTHDFDASDCVQLGHFTVIERIRTGGMGAVFRALDTRLSRVVALKVLPPALSRDPLIVQRFKNEAQAAAQLDHENVARVYFIGEDHGLNYIAFEFINGTNVRDLIAEHTRLSVAEAVNYILQIAAALVHTSSQGVVHRDIKPSNIIITPAGRAKLVDLGLARKENKDEQAVDLTVAGTTLGTFDYISPEQARDPRAADVRSDIYSLGCTLYHMLTGAPPYPDGTVLQKLLQHQGDEAPDPALKNALVPENLSVVVRKMMAKDPRRRYQTPEQLVRDLMLVAGALGLRSVSPEGLIWLAAQSEQTSFWERHLAWMVTAAMLFVIVGYMEFGGGFYAPAPGAGSPSGQSPTAGNRVPLVTGTAGAGRSLNPPHSDLTGSSTDLEPISAKDPAKELVAGSARDDSRLSADDNDSKLSSDKRGTRPSANSGTHDEEADSDETIGEFVPIPLVAASRSSDEGVSLGPRFDKTFAGLGQPGPRTVANPPGSVARVGAAAEDFAPDDRPSTVAEATSSEVDSDREILPAVAAPKEGIFMLGRDGAPDQRFVSLEAACSSVRTDGAVIELRFNGRRRETAFRINRKVAIRAARGYRPVVEFRPTEAAADTYQVRAVSIPSGALDLVGVDVTLLVDETVSAEQWSLFSLERADSLRLEGVTVTLVNPRQRSVAAIELRPGVGDKMPDMPDAGAQPRPPLQVEIAESLIRGDGDLFLVRHAEPARLAIKQSVAALQGTLLSARGNSEMSHENTQLELRLEHVTAILAGGLVRLDSGNVPRKMLPVQISASNSIFSNTAGTPLIGMTGNSPPQDFHALLFWSGQSNFYDRYQTFWSIVSTEAIGRSETWNSETWRRNWTEASESNPRFEVVWDKRRWLAKPFSELVPGDFSLDRQAANNPAVGGATNFSDAGANLAGLPKPVVVPVSDAAGDKLRD